MLDLLEAEKIALENAKDNLIALQNNDFEYFTREELNNMGYVAGIRVPRALSQMEEYYADGSIRTYTGSKQILDTIFNYINKLRNWQGVKS